jgi:hypothetical protein
MDGFLLGCSFVPWVVKGASQSMNIKIILDGKATFSSSWNDAQKCGSMESRTYSQDKVLTTAVQHEFLFYFVGDFP